MSDRDRAYLLDIQESIRLIEEYCRGGEMEFLAAQFLQDAVIRRLEIIGEASQRLSIQLRDSNADVPWKQVCGLRDVLIHDYGMVNVKMIWKIVENNLPSLKLCVEKLLR